MALPSCGNAASFLDIVSLSGLDWCIAGIAHCSCDCRSSLSHPSLIRPSSRYQTSCRCHSLRMNHSTGCPASYCSFLVGLGTLLTMHKLERVPPTEPQPIYFQRESTSSICFFTSVSTATRSATGDLYVE